jgi:hypothetical protein
MAHAASDDRAPALPSAPRRRRSALPLIGEPVAPWLAAAFVLAALNLAAVASGYQLPVLEQALLLIGLCATLAAGGLVAARSNRRLEASAREERARPAGEELVAPGSQPGSESYVEGMACWAEAVLELLDHAVDTGRPKAPAHDELVAAAADTRELRDLLRSSSQSPLSINDAAMIHAVCTLWEVNEARVEALAAEVDLIWHRRWRARTVADRRLRHGSVAPQTLVLPYRSVS